MMNRLAASALFFIPLAASADTLTMKNGTSYQGTFNNADANRMSFTDYNGSRRDVSMNDVQELRFGNNQGINSNDRFDRNSGNNSRNNQPYSRDSQPYSRNDQADLRNQQGSNSGVNDDLDRLRQDLRSAMDNGNLSSSQRRDLQDAHDNLRNMLQQSRDGRALDQAGVRSALGAIRNNMDYLQRDDRERIREDMRRLRSDRGGQNY